MDYIKDLFEKYIKDTEYKSMIVISNTLICELNNKIKLLINNDQLISLKVYISTKSLKHIYDRHIYDKKTPGDFNLILENLSIVISNPDRIYNDTPDKRGNYIFVKKIKNKFCMCTLEIINKRSIEVVSSSITGEKYLSKFTLLWSWGTANSPS